jgi:hypothetical protein
VAQVTFRANQAGLNRLLRDRNGPVVLHVANVGREVEGAARRLVPVVSGDLKRSIGSRLERRAGGWGAEVFSDIVYATWIHDGKRFDPRSGRIIYVKVGPRPFLLQALRSVGLSYSRRV